MPVSFRRRNKSYTEPEHGGNDKYESILQLMPGESAKNNSFHLSKNSLTTAKNLSSSKKSLSSSRKSIHNFFSNNNNNNLNTTQFSAQHASAGTSLCSLGGISSLPSEDGTVNGSQQHLSSADFNECDGYSMHGTYGSSYNKNENNSSNTSPSKLTVCFKRHFTRGISYSAETQARKNEAIRLQKERNEKLKEQEEEQTIQNSGKPVKRTKSFTFNTFSLEKFRSKNKQRNPVGRSQSTKTIKNEIKCGSSLLSSKGKLGSFGKLACSGGGLPPQPPPPPHRHVAVENDFLNYAADLTSAQTSPR